MAVITVLGSSGYIGSRLALAAQRQGHEVVQPGRDLSLAGTPLGTVLYCIGLTGDYRSHPFDTVEAHVCHLSHILQHCRFDRLIYLSSTRLYLDAFGNANEDAVLAVRPAWADDLYNLSKALGESLALNSGRPACVVRLSNVYGDDWTSMNFLPTILKAAIRDRVVSLQSDPRSSKDYIGIDDVVDLLMRIALQGTQRIYNLASGRNVSHGELIDRIRRIFPCAVHTIDNAPLIAFSQIDIERVRDEFGFSPKCLLDELPGLLAAYQLHRSQWN